VAKTESQENSYPDIYEVQGLSSPGFMVSFRIHGLGQRTPR
jgi:hypothetical protein